jgi:hypothetical protein
VHYLGPEAIMLGFMQPEPNVATPIYRRLSPSPQETALPYWAQCADV